MDPEKIGKFICELRKEKNLSQYQLADMIPITRQGVSKWERGVTTPDTQTLIKLSELFDVSIDELLKGERIPVKTIESLEQTTLSILDQSNKKTKKIKRITFISISIITILLLAFLSYYFINSYNSTKVYTIYGEGNDFKTYDGLMIITKEKAYIKLGKLTNKKEHQINNLKMYYKYNGKNKKLVEGQDIDTLAIRDNIGYAEKINEKYINNLYLEITYNENEKEIIKLKFVKDFSNNKLFFTQQQKGEIKTEKQEEIKPVEENKEEPPKEEVKETIKEELKTIKAESKEKEKTKEEPKKETVKTEESKKEDNKQEETNKTEETPTEEPQPEPAPEPEITTEQIINKIKETCANTNSNYTCSYNNYNVIIMYDSVVNKISIYNERKYIGDYQINEDAYYCKIENCEETFSTIIKEYLFS